MRNTAIIVMLTLLIAPLNVGASGSATSINLNANPSSIIADGRSAATVTAEIRDMSGSPVPDGTVVSFSSDIGTIQATATVMGGVARARFTSAATAGTATISAWATTGGAVGQLKIDMLAPGSEVSRQTYVSVSAKYLVYDPEKLIIYASGGAIIKHRGLVIATDEAQIDVQSGSVKCRMASGGEPIKLTRKNKSLECSLLVYRLSEGKGEAMVDGEKGKVHKVSVRAADLTTQPNSDYAPPSYFDFADMSSSQFLVKASSIVLRPGEELRMHRAKVYVDGKKVMSMRMHVIPIGGVTNQVSRYVGWSANGLRVDLPFFYSVSANGVGSLRLRTGQQEGWGYYSGNTGWALDLVHEYTTDNGGSGGIAINRISSLKDWGAQWHHNQDLAGGGSVYSYVDFPSHHDLFGMTTINKPLGSLLNLGANLYGNKPSGQALGLSSDLYLQTNPKPIASGLVNYVLRASTALSSGAASGLAGNGTGLQLQLTGHPIKLQKTTSINTSFTLGQSWGSRGGVNMLANASLTHRIGKAGSAGVSYSFVRDNALTGDYGQHRLSGNLLYSPSKRWHANIFGTYTLDKPQSSGFADLSYEVIPGWRMSLLQTLQQLGTYSYTDTEVAVGKVIAGHEVNLVWSKARNRVTVEFSAARF
jgi:hypothetical protein